MLLIVAPEFDPHADAVIAALRMAGHVDLVRVDLETAPKKFQFKWIHGNAVNSWRLENAAMSSIACGSTDSPAVWWRRTSSFFRESPQDSPSVRSLDAYELHWAVRWAIEALPGSRFPLGHPVAMRAAENKILQLEWATRLGFRSPRTLISSDPLAILEFAHEFGEVVVKPLHAAVVSGSSLSSADKSEGGDARFVGPVPIREAALRASLVGYDSTALCVQERIKKVADVRVTVLPTGAIACAINAEGLSPDEVDWRPKTFDHAHRIVELPSAVERFCRDYLKAMGIVWGAFDFALSADGEWTFFECNPNGQWLWIELKTGAPLSRLFAEALVVSGDD